MKWNQLKEIVNSLTDEELQQEVMYLSKSLYIKGIVQQVKKTEENLYCISEDDPSGLYTKEEVTEMVGDKSGAVVGLTKGTVYLEI